MNEEFKNALEKILLPLGSDWELTQIDVDEESETVYIRLQYTQQEVRVNDFVYKLYDYRQERSWRHLDLWHYKTYIVARVPRYKDIEGVKTIEVPWSDHHERITWRLEKKQ
jgi:hypothetical protein